ncbi:hypothetical protein [Paenibacillus amylolyticus]|uniref:hypothetical protein n=1 Tax=Paenibacillus TaxID=44249 RepID=UPI00249AAB5A|nr:hypothetical protein [Paenibacillus amylolyticus]WFA87642.1 hypothetical protein OGI70_12310 [Paenibacillus amylolyticus]
MTLIATAYAHECIVMGTDTLLQRTENYQTNKIIGYGSIQKLFFIRKTGTGISVRGRASWGEKTIKQILQNFTHTVESSMRQCDVADALQLYIKSNFPQLETSYHKAGYQDTEPFIYDLDFDSGLNLVRENVDRKGFLRYSVLARIDDTEVRNQVLPLPDFSKMQENQVFDFMETLFKLKIQAENLKPTPSVGYPIDYLFLSHDQSKFVSNKIASDFLLD